MIQNHVHCSTRKATPHSRLGLSLECSASPMIIHQYTNCQHYTSNSILIIELCLPNDTADESYPFNLVEFAWNWEQLRLTAKVRDLSPSLMGPTEFPYWRLQPAEDLVAMPARQYHARCLSFSGITRNGKDRGWWWWRSPENPNFAVLVVVAFHRLGLYRSAAHTRSYERETTNSCQIFISTVQDFSASDSSQLFSILKAVNFSVHHVQL